MTDFIITGVTGQSSLVGTWEIFTMMSRLALSTHLPKTGWCAPAAQRGLSRFLVFPPPHPRRRAE